MKDKSSRQRVWFLAGVLLAIMVSSVAAMRAAAQPQTVPPAAPPPTPGIVTQEPAGLDDTLAQTNCRYGVAYVFGDSLEWVSTLDAGWYLNFTSYAPSIHSAEFVPVVSVKQVITGGVRQPQVTYNPPLSYYYRHTNGQIQPGLGTLILQNPGRLWLVGNEMDVDNPVQGNTMPDVYARAYHDAYYFIKGIDPTARVAIAGLSMMTPGRLQYLDIVWDTYKQVYGENMPVDVWNMHLYILEERNPLNPNEYGDGKIALGTDKNLAKLTSYGASDPCPPLGAADTNANDPRADVYCRSEHDSVRIFRDQVYNMRNWMKAHGQQDKPLIISEYGLLYVYLDPQPNGGCEFLQDEHQKCFYPERVTKYLRDTVKFLEETTDPNLGYPKDGNRLVQQWLWYSIVTEPEWSGGSSNLIVRNYGDYTPGDPSALTMAGLAFQQEATLRVGSVNLTGGEGGRVTTYVQQPAKTTSAMISATFRNSGTRSVIAPFNVTFYKDPGLTQVIGTATVQPNQTGAVTGCTWEARNNERVTIKWDNLPVGTHYYWAKIDSGGTIGEALESDNVTTRGMVVVNKYSNFAPVVGNLFSPLR
jgi:hypothetical protein